MLQTKYSGLNQQEVENLLEQYGPNTLKTKAKRSILNDLYQEIKKTIIFFLIKSKLFSYI